MLQAVAGAVARHLLGAGGAVAVTEGVVSAATAPGATEAGLSANDIQLVLGAIATLISVVWSVWEKVRSGR